MIENGKTRRSEVGMSRTLFAWVPENGLATGEMRTWAKSHSGVVIVYEMHWKMSPITPILLIC